MTNKVNIYMFVAWFRSARSSAWLGSNPGLAWLVARLGLARGWVQPEVRLDSLGTTFLGSVRLILAKLRTCSKLASARLSSGSGLGSGRAGN